MVRIMRRMLAELSMIMIFLAMIHSFLGKIDTRMKSERSRRHLFQPFPFCFANNPERSPQPAVIPWRIAA